MNRKLLIGLATLLALVAGAGVVWLVLAGIAGEITGRAAGAWTLALPLVLLGAGYEPTRRWITRWVDARLFPRKRALDELDASLLSDLAGATSLDEVASRLVSTLKTSLRLTSASLFVSDATGRFYRLRASRGVRGDTEKSLIRNDELTAWRIAWDTRPIRAVEARAHDIELPGVFREFEADSLVPVTYHDELLGLLVLGATIDGSMLDDADLDRLAVLAGGTSALLENARLFALASNDTVTGLSRRRIFQERLAQELVRSRRTLRPFSVAIADIDDFKKLNDTYGHPAGDVALKKISRMLANGCRRSDTVSRIGGEEFAILFPETPASDAAARSDVLRQSIADREIEITAGVAVRITLSVGVCGWTPMIDEEDLDAHQVIERADRALYRAKRAGKNRVLCDESDAADTPTS